jgi:acetyltransferase-like isoleucine patch superfamily enzyme
MLPWALRRWCLRRFFGFEIDATAWIGLAWVYPRFLQMGPGSRIGHGTVCVHLDEVRLGEHARVGRLNWITGFPQSDSATFFKHVNGRIARLQVGRHAAITNRHLIDCTSEVNIGAFATVAGFRSQLLSHSVDLAANRQHSSPIVIGERCFVGTGCIVLGGAKLPTCSVLGAGSLLNKAYEQTHTLYAGQPARAVKQLEPNINYFTRETGFVN